MTLVEAIATFFGLICVWLTVKQNILCWPTGIVQVTLYIFVFYDARLYSDMILHIIYVIINVYGWYHWLYGNKEKEELNVSLVGKWIWMWLIICVLGTLAWGYVMATYTNAALPYFDSFITAASLIAQWLMARKIVESWWFWIVVDIVAVGVYFVKGLYITTGLYAVFLVMATMGYFEWQRAYRKEKPMIATV
jgi:nicotinamide mononucleotide transporter